MLRMRKNKYIPCTKGGKSVSVWNAEIDYMPEAGGVIPFGFALLTVISNLFNDLFIFFL